MKTSKKVPYLILLAIFTILSGCISNDKKSNNTANENNSTDDDSDTEYRISTYEFHISGGALDGQSFSGAFPNDGGHGQGQLLSKVADNIPNDVVRINFSDEKEQGNYISVYANLVLDDNGKLVPIANAASDASYMKQSTLTIQIGDNIEDMTKRQQFSSKSGTVSLSNLELEQDATKSLASMIDCDVSFEAEFYSIDFGTGKTPQAVPVSITGEFHIKSIRNNNN